MADNSNIGYAFPLEKLGSDIARNSYNHHSILSGLIEWNNTIADTVTIRLTKDSDPWYEDYTIPSKKSILTVGTYNCDITGVVGAHLFSSALISSALYGGRKTFITTTFDASTSITVNPTNTITLVDGSQFNIGDRLKLEVESGGSLPTGLDSSTAYYILSNPSANVITLTTSKYPFTGSPATVALTSVGSGIVTVYKYSDQVVISEEDTADSAVIRATVSHGGNAQWSIYYSPVVETWQSNSSYIAGNIVLYSNTYYKVLFDVSSSIEVPSVDSANFDPLIKQWVTNNQYHLGDLVQSPLGDLYIKITTTSSPTSPENNSTDYVLYARKWISGTTYAAGSYIYDSGLLYLASSDVIDSTTSPFNGGDSAKWEHVILLKVPTSDVFSSSVVFVWELHINVASFRLRNEGNEASIGTTAINIRISGKTKEPASIYQRSVDTFMTSNYGYWPYDKNSIWSSMNTYGPTDDTIPINKRQDYSATMIFEHTRPDVAKSVNFINYDGPDLDQGLCIYLPVQIDVGDDGVAYPEDGYTYEFFFRIWPNTSLNNEITRDHIVNKAQIYVYSALDLDSISSDLCEVPIAKFSMARATNFYMFGENVTIPDKPVCYRATFVYNAADQKWCTLDYYQLPDHIFVGPVGFIDPQSPANLDINDAVIGNINPNAANIGYETAAFPLFQDPFSNPDLSPYRVSGDSLDTFRNRII